MGKTPEAFLREAVRGYPDAKNAVGGFGLELERRLKTSTAGRYHEPTPAAECRLGG